MQAVILAGGLGTRLAPYTTVLPKPLMPIGEMPVLEVIIRQLRRAGFTRIELATGYLSGLLEAYFGDGSRWDVQIRYHLERERAGTAGPIALLGDSLDDVFLAMNGDVLTDLDFRDLYDAHARSGAVLTAATCARSVTLPLGAIVHGSDGAIIDYVEKPTYHFECSAGIYAMKKDVVRFIERGRPYDLPELVRHLIDVKQPIRTHPIEGFWLDIGTPEDFRRANEEFAALFPDIAIV
ncbi:MAG: sugar phosphate nucleotidyltransferase [Candidatus Baltobacteraceae bacterium]